MCFFFKGDLKVIFTHAAVVIKTTYIFRVILFLNSPINFIYVKLHFDSEMSLKMMHPLQAHLYVHGYNNPYIPMPIS